MINLNVNQMTESSNRVNNVLNNLSNSALLYVLGVVDAPMVGQTVIITTKPMCEGVVDSIDLVEGIARVRYTRKVTRYKKEEGTENDYQDWKNSVYCVPFKADEETTDRFEFRYLDF